MFFVTSDVIGQAGSAAPQPRTVPGLPRSQPVARSPVPGPPRSQRASRSPVPGPHLVYRRKASAVGPREDRVWLGSPRACNLFSAILFMAVIINTLKRLQTLHSL